MKFERIIEKNISYHFDIYNYTIEGFYKLRGEDFLNILNEYICDKIKKLHSVNKSNMILYRSIFNFYFNWYITNYKFEDCIGNQNYKIGWVTLKAKAVWNEKNNKFDIEKGKRIVLMKIKRKIMKMINSIFNKIDTNMEKMYLDFIKTKRTFKDEMLEQERYFRSLY